MLIALPIGKIPAVDGMKALVIVEGAGVQSPEAQPQGDKDDNYIEGDLPVEGERT
jgi:ribosomal protein L24